MESVFKNKDIFVGIDVHKKRWVVTVRSYDLELKTFSMDASAEELERIFSKLYPGALLHIVYECSFSGFRIYDYFKERDYDIIVTPTNRILRDGSVVKTDKIDSRKLAFQLSRGLLKEVIVPTEKIREYRSIFKIYDKQKEREGVILREIRCILEQRNNPMKWEKWNKAFVEKLKTLKFEEAIFNRKFAALINEYEFVCEQIKNSRDLIKEISSDEELQKRILRIEKISGVGIISAVRIVVFLFDKKDRFLTGNQLTHHIGLTPSEWSSGEGIRKGKTGLSGDKHLRSIIIQLAWVAVRKDGSLMDKFDKVYKNTACKQKAIVAVARKLMMKIHAITIKEEDYEVNKAA